jgi:hypothetical protein
LASPFFSCAAVKTGNAAIAAPVAAAARVRNLRREAPSLSCGGATFLISLFNIFSSDGVIIQATGNELGAYRCPGNDCAGILSCGIPSYCAAMLYPKPLEIKG